MNPLRARRVDAYRVVAVLVPLGVERPGGRKHFSVLPDAFFFDFFLGFSRWACLLDSYWTVVAFITVSSCVFGPLY